MCGAVCGGGLIFISGGVSGNEKGIKGLGGFLLRGIIHSSGGFWRLGDNKRIEE